MNLEEVFGQLASKRDIAISCSFLTDNFDDEAHARMLPRLRPAVICATGMVP